MIRMARFGKEVEHCMNKDISISSELLGSLRGLMMISTPESLRILLEPFISAVASSESYDEDTYCSAYIAAMALGSEELAATFYSTILEISGDEKCQELLLVERVGSSINEFTKEIVAGQGALIESTVSFVELLKGFRLDIASPILLSVGSAILELNKLDSSVCDRLTGQLNLLHSSINSTIAKGKSVHVPTEALEMLAVELRLLLKPV